MLTEKGTSRASVSAAKNIVTFQEQRVEMLRKQLKYPLKSQDSEGSEFWYLRPGQNADEAIDTCPIAVGFVDELNTLDGKAAGKWLTQKEQQQRFYGHYVDRVAENKPVMYLLFPSGETGQAAMVLPSEGGLKARNVQTFDLESQAFRTRLNRLMDVPIAERALISIPLVEFAFYPPIKTAKELAVLLAEAAREIEQVIPAAYKAEAENGHLHRLFEDVRSRLLTSLVVKAEKADDYGFSDMYAQTIVYSLFTARIFGHLKDEREGREKETLFDRRSAWELLPKTNPFLRNIFKDISAEKTTLPDELVSVIDRVFSILRAVQMQVILSDFQSKGNREDLVIRFYEDFLAAYNPGMREKRGVYYTPEPVVGYIVRSVDHILKTDFGLKDGLADASKVAVEQADGSTKDIHKVLITDVAVGTGTFLNGVIDQIHASFKPKKGDWAKYIEKDLLPRLLGFELLMAPYAVAHMKLGLKLAELGYGFETEERLRVYLTNTLQEAFQIPPAEGCESWVWDEADAANRVKQEAPVMVVMGNPPYSGHSANNGEWIRGLLRGHDSISGQATSNYFEVDGKPLGERNPKWLNDDYVKFIRFGQWRIEQTGHGVLAFITNHGFIDNPTFRGMRQSLMQTFDDIYILDLHGNTKKKETCTDGSKDENVFDIQQGVVICIFVKRPNSSTGLANVFHSDLLGFRDKKYNYLDQNSCQTENWNIIKPQDPFYLFSPLDTDLFNEYDKGWKITDLIPVNSVGIVTARDALTIHYSEKDIWETVQDFVSLHPDQAREKYSLGSDARDWKITLAQDDIRKSNILPSNIVPILYRPFDIRHTYYTGKSKGFHCMPRGGVMQHLLAGENLALITSRLTKGETFHHAQVSQNIAEVICMSPKTSNNGFVFPLYLYPETEAERAMGMKRRPNLSQPFLDDITHRLGYTPTPEAIFHYIYAISHSPPHLTRYAEFLKIDFPRVPLTRNNNLFTQLATLGEQLVQLHLMKSPKLTQKKAQPKFIDNGGDSMVDPGQPKFINGNVIINKKGDAFANVPETTWNFHIGGYQVCHKWLKDRKGRQLSSEDIQHYQQVVVALGETIRVMEAIDQAIPNWPIQ
jgi:predicted helicase